jgi:uncharacterized protein (TIGR03435 family)
MILEHLPDVRAAASRSQGNHLQYLMIVAVVMGIITSGVMGAAQSSSQPAPTTGATSLSFEVASVKPNHSGDNGRRIMFGPGRFTASGATIRFLITMAYMVKEFQVSGGPSWVDSERYNIDAKEEDSLAKELEKLPQDERMQKKGLLIPSLLADRFQLRLGHATKELPIYVLVIAKNGPKLREAKPGTYNGIKGRDGIAHGGSMHVTRGQLECQAASLDLLAFQLSQQLGRNVVDHTGLKGNYDFIVKWTPDPNEGAMFKEPQGGRPYPDNAPPESSGPSIFTAIQEQLGLKLESTKAPVDILVIDHIERPSED